MKKNLTFTVCIALFLIFGIALFLFIPEKTDVTEEFIKGIQNNEIREVQNALKNGANPNTEVNGVPALVQAIRNINGRNKDLSIPQLLVNAGADISNPAVIIATLRLAASDIYISDLESDFIPSLISSGADVNVKIDGINDVFCYSLKYNLNFRILKAAAGAGADINGHVDGKEWLPIEYCIRNGKHNIVSTLVYLGSEQPKDIEGKSIKEYVLQRYGEGVANAFYKCLFSI